MPKRRQPPPPGFVSAGTWTLHPPLGDGELKELAESLDVEEFPSEHIDTLQEAVRDYLDGFKDILDQPLSADVRKEVETLLHFANGLSETINNLGTLSMNKLINAYVCERMDLWIPEPGMSSSLHPKDIDDGLDRCKKDSAKIARVAERTLKRWPKVQGAKHRKRGRLQRLIVDLAEIYPNITGGSPTNTWNPYSEKFEGDFLNFVDMVLHFVDEDIPNTTLGGQIRDTLKRFKKKPPP